MEIPATWMRAAEPDLVTRQRNATEEAVKLSLASAMREQLFAGWNSMTVFEQEAAVARARAQRDEEDRRRREQWEAEAAADEQRHAAVRQRADTPALCAILALHARDENGMCPACSSEDYDNDYYNHATDWPCATFLAVEAAL